VGIQRAVKLIMRQRYFPARLSACGTLLLLCVALASADTIVLKNGRRIVALTAVIEGDKVRYETRSGTLTIPKSIVDHIEKGPGGNYEADAANFAMAAPALAPLAFSQNDVEQNTIHDGAVDRTFLTKLDEGAHGGSRDASQAAALGHHTAAQFEITHGEMEQAMDDERSALNFAPNETMLLLNLGYLHLKRSEFKQSLEYLDRARRIAPDDPEVTKLTGWAYYGLNKLDLAVSEWKKSLLSRPDQEVQAALAKAERDKDEEAGYKENESRHFALKYSGAAEPGLARDVLHTLEAHYEAIESELSFSPPDSIGVVLYTRQAFMDITNAPSWAGAMNDGRLRVPVQGLTSMTPELSRVLKHELAHSFIQQKTHGLAPTWLQEGLAQWLEGKRSGDNASALIQSHSAGQAATLTQLEGSWMHFTDVAAQAAYAWGLATIEAIVATSSMTDVVRILEHIAAGEKPEAAVHAILNSDYSELMGMTTDYLRKTYSR
jgi:tetratricopeptide (TPR) repeat protein